MPSTRKHEALAMLVIVNSVALALLALNAATQWFEDSVSRVQAVRVYRLDPIWYLDDLVGPALFTSFGLGWLWFRLPDLRPRTLLAHWPIVLLGGIFVAFGLGDTLDAHWVIAEGLHAPQTTSTFTSFLAKFLFTILFCLGLVHAWDRLAPTARRGLAFVFFLMVINQLFLSMGMDFRGAEFHVFEELLEVLAGLWLLALVFPHPIRPPA